MITKVIWAHLIDHESKIFKFKYNSNNTNTITENTNYVYVTRRNSRSLNEKHSIEWIERLLQMPLSEHRKYCIWRILAPYFINVKHLSFGDSYGRICQWLESCSQLRVLDFDPATKINDSLNRAINTGYMPISLDNPFKEPRTLKTDNRELYNII
jgi:Primase X